MGLADRMADRVADAARRPTSSTLLHGPAGVRGPLVPLLTSGPVSTDTLKKGTRVVLNTDLNGVAEGTAGRVGVSSGLTWLKYWVTFDNGRQMGSVGHSKLVPEDEWEHFLENRERLEAEAAEKAKADAAAAAKKEESSGGGGGDDRLAALLARSKAAKEKKGA